jgi:segregation and condensation protein B
MDSNKLTATVEALILASPEPIASKKIAEADDNLTPSKVTEAVKELNSRYESNGGSFRIREVAGGYQFYILPDFTRYVEELFTRRRKMRLTRAALETLAIVAYKQPVTKVDIDHIRGVSSDGVLHNLLEKNLVTIKGRSESVGRPMEYGTTDEFLKFFGINQLEDLPDMTEIEELVKAADGDRVTDFNLDDGAEQESETESETDETNRAGGEEGTEDNDDTDGNETHRVTLIREPETEEQNK